MVALAKMRSSGNMGVALHHLPIGDMEHGRVCSDPDAQQPIRWLAQGG